MSVALRIALLLVLIACVYLFLAQPYWFPAGASSMAASFDHQFKIALWVLGGMFIAGHLVLAYVLSRRPRANGASSSGSWKLEVGWTAVIAAIFFWFNVSGEPLWSSMMSMPQKQPGQVLIEVTGAQFQWYFRYAGPDGVFGRIDAQKFSRPDEGNPLGIDPGDPAGRDDMVTTSMVVPVGRLVQLRLRAQDVVHSLYIPAMRFKQDTVPGMEIHSHFTPTRVGSYEIACAELCGLGHYRMRAVVRVLSDEDFARWLKTQEKSAME
jgi:cytochrome c oxidase subunit II